MARRAGNKSGKNPKRVAKRNLVRKRGFPPQIKKFLGAGKQTEAGVAVMAYSLGFSGKSIETVRAIISDLASFKRMHLKPGRLTELYAKRTAGEIIGSRSVATAGSTQGSYSAVLGCIDYNLALCAVLRAKGIPAKFTREGIHSTTHFYINGRWFEADPVNRLSKRLTSKMRRRESQRYVTRLGPVIRSIGPERQVEIRRGKQRGTYAEGLDAWDLGIHSIKDFRKYERAKV